jgi:hypothetical protein
MTDAVKKLATSMPREEVQVSFVSYATRTSSRICTLVIPSHHEA